MNFFKKSRTFLNVYCIHYFYTVNFRTLTRESGAAGPREHMFALKPKKKPWVPFVLSFSPRSIAVSLQRCLPTPYSNRCGLWFTFIYRNDESLAVVRTLSEEDLLGYLCLTPRLPQLPLP